MLMRQPPANAPEESGDDWTKDVDHLKEAVQRAARQIRLLQWSLWGVVLVIAGALVGSYEAGYLRIEGLSPPVVRRVEAKEFGFYNRFDTRVVLEADDKWGLPQLIFMDLKKNYRMGIKVWPEGDDGTPGMVFYDHSGSRGNFRMEGDGSSVLNLVGENKKGGIAMAVAKDGTPSLKVSDKTGKVLFQVPAEAP
jgi:hypothetical protein